MVRSGKPTACLLEARTRCVGRLARMHTALPGDGEQCMNLFTQRVHTGGCCRGYPTAIRPLCHHVSRSRLAGGVACLSSSGGELKLIRAQVRGGGDGDATSGRGRRRRRDRPARSRVARAHNLGSERERANRSQAGTLRPTGRRHRDTHTHPQTQTQTQIPPGKAPAERAPHVSLPYTATPTVV